MSTRRRRSGGELMTTLLFRKALFLTAALALLRGRPLFGQDPTQYERVLVPISVSLVAGAYGSTWSTELWFRNNTDRPVVVFPLAISDSVPVIRRTELLPIGSRPAHAPGQFLFVTRTAEAEVQFDSRLFNRNEPRAPGARSFPSFGMVSSETKSI